LNELQRLTPCNNNGNTSGQRTNNKTKQSKATPSKAKHNRTTQASNASITGESLKVLSTKREAPHRHNAAPPQQPAARNQTAICGVRVRT